VRGRSECLGSGRTMPASRQTGKVSMHFKSPLIPRGLELLQRERRTW